VAYICGANIAIAVGGIFRVGCKQANVLTPTTFTFSQSQGFAYEC
jgi:hypothetical protein